MRILLPLVSGLQKDVEVIQVVMHSCRQEITWRCYPTIQDPVRHLVVLARGFGRGLAEIGVYMNQNTP